MNANQLNEALSACIDSGYAALVEGKPGTGKSSIVRALAAARGVDLIDVRAALLDPVDLRGLPSIEGGSTRWNPPVFLPQTGEGILFLDEVGQAPPMVQNALFQLVLDRRLGEYALPDGWCVVGATNRVEDRAGVQRMNSALRDRFVILQLDITADEWALWGLHNNIPVELLAFAKFKPQLIGSFDPSQQKNPTLRGWERVGRMMNVVSPAIEYETFAGCVGEAAATELVAFLRLFRELPNIDNIVMNPQKSPVPKEIGALYSVAAALAHKMTDNTIDNIVIYLERLPVEYSVLAIKMATSKNPRLCATKGYIRWATKNQYALK